jgi:TolA-binding protein
MKRALLTSVLFCNTALLSACWVPTGVGNKMEEDIKNLQRSQDILARKIEQRQAQWEESLEKAQTIEETVTKLNQSARLNDADFGAQMQQVIEEVQTLRGALEVAENRINQLEGKTDSSAPSEDTSAPPAPKFSSKESPKQALERAKKLIEAHQMEEAREAIEFALEKSKKEERDEAYFLLGESYYGEKNYRTALKHYIHVIDKYPRSEFADDTMYRIGQSSLSLGQKAEAKVFFHEIVKRYKSSPWYNAAKRELKALEDKEKKKN